MTLYEQKKVQYENSKWRYWKESQKAYIDVTGQFLEVAEIIDSKGGDPESPIEAQG